MKYALAGEGRRRPSFKSASSILWSCASSSITYCWSLSLWSMSLSRGVCTGRSEEDMMEAAQAGRARGTRDGGTRAEVQCFGL